LTHSQQRSLPTGCGRIWLVKGPRAVPFHESKVPMKAANLCPSPLVVAQRVTDLTRDIDQDCSFNNRDKFQQLLETSRENGARQLMASADEIALVRNTSEANNVINNGLQLRPGDEIVLWDQNHPTNNVAWDVRAARFELTVTRTSRRSQERTCVRGERQCVALDEGTELHPRSMPNVSL
jgi:selenocysteine lyase/cysteine desulfurase